MDLDLARYNKLIAGLLGNLLPIVLVWLATKTPMASCAVVDAKQVCTLLGMGVGELTATLMVVFNAVFLAFGPKNSVTRLDAVKEVAKNPDYKVTVPNTIEGRAINNQTSGNVSVTILPNVTKQAT